MTEAEKSNGTMQAKALPKVMDPQAQMRKKKQERLNKLLSGEQPPPNEFAGFIIEQLRSTMAQGQQVSQKLAQAQAMVKQLEEEALRLEGVANQYANDLDKWDKPAQAQAQGAVPKGGNDDKAEATGG